jgi:hypothetical protein
MNGKKSGTLAAIRISEKMAKEYRLALEYYNISAPAYARMCVSELIRHYRSGDKLAMPMECVFRKNGG